MQFYILTVILRVGIEV